ncbi:MAG: hypothetical protein K0S08_813 [Gammaproteobacteria bacterium]|jgi:hypothetical protein|nr:hypothetical protein [Gammaproteobacteria bacterium]
MISILSYHQLNLAQRKSLIAFSVSLLMLFAYFPRYETILQQCGQAKLAFKTNNHLYQQQEKVIKNMSSIKQEVTKLEKSLAQQAPKPILQQQAQDLGLNDFSFQNNISGYEFSFKTSLKTALNFFAKPVVKNLAGKITYLNLEQELNQQDIRLLVQIEAKKNVNFNEKESPAEPENNLILPVEQTEWVGKLTLDHQAPVAFLKLPNQKIIGLSVGEGYGDSSWKILEINEHGVKLQDSNNQVMIRNFG